jgi:hypothetical protein
MYKVIWGVDRELKKMDFTLMQYYRGLTEAWNVVAEKYVKKNEDGRTNEYKDWRRFINALVHMNDMIIQAEGDYEKTIREQDEEIRRLKFELSKWTDNQRGRRRKITPYIEKRIREEIVEGKSKRAVAQQFKVDEKMVRMILKKDAR